MRAIFAIAALGTGLFIAGFLLLLLHMSGRAPDIGIVADHTLREVLIGLLFAVVVLTAGMTIHAYQVLRFEPGNRALWGLVFLLPIAGPLLYYLAVYSATPRQDERSE